MAVAKRSDPAKQGDIAAPVRDAVKTGGSGDAAGRPGGPVGDMHRVLEKKLAARTGGATAAPLVTSTSYELERIVSKWAGIATLALAVCGLATLLF